MSSHRLAARQAPVLAAFVALAIITFPAAARAQAGPLAGCDPDGPTPAFLSAANDVFYGCQSLFRSSTPQYYSAIGRFESAVGKEPTNAVAQFLLGAALAGYGKRDSARAVLRRALATEAGVRERLAPRLAERPQVAAAVDAVLAGTPEPRAAATATASQSTAAPAPRSAPAAAKARPAAAFKAGDVVEIRPSGGDWQRGVVVSVEDDRGDGSLYLYQVRHEVVPGKPSTSTTSRMWPQNIRAARAPAPPSAAAVASAELVYGSYACTHDSWTGPPSARRRTSEAKGSLLLRRDGSYRLYDNGDSGRYAYDKATRAIRWLSGPMATMRPERTTFQRNVKTAQVDIRLSGDYDWSCGINL